MARPERDVIYGAGLTFLIQSGTLITDENLRQEIAQTAEVWPWISSGEGDAGWVDLTVWAQ